MRGIFVLLAGSASSPALCLGGKQGTLMLRPPTNRLCNIAIHILHPEKILSTVIIFYCDSSTMWHFSTVTFRLCDNFLWWHFDNVTFFYFDIPTQSGRIVPPPWKVDSLSHCDILTNCNFVQSIAVTFCPLWILTFPVDTLSKLQLILTNDYLVNYPFNFFASTYRFRRPRSDRGCAEGCFFDYFSDPTIHLEATATFSNFPRDDFDHCDILSTLCETSPKASRWSLVTCDKTSAFCFRAKVDVLSQSR